MEVPKVCSDASQLMPLTYEAPTIQIFKIHHETNGGHGDSPESEGGLLLAS